MVKGRQCSVYVDLATQAFRCFNHGAIKDSLTERFHLDSQSPIESQLELTRSSAKSENTNSVNVDGLHGITLSVTENS